jgi:hypothetical protein
MSTPATMKLFMPKDEKEKKDQTEIKESGALTIMLGKNNGLYYYEGFLKADGSNFKTSTYKEIRDIIINKKKAVMENGRRLGQPKDTLDKDLFVTIKPNPEATYKNTVDILDEMTINQVHRFALIDITEDENKLIKATESSNQK